MTARAPEKRPGFEKALERLESLVAEMEGGSLSLDKMMAHFEEGMGLVRFCSGKLNEVERRIEVLVRKGEGVAAEPFRPEEPLEDEAGAEDASAQTPNPPDEEPADTDGPPSR